MRSNTGKNNLRPRTGISALYYDEFLRHFSGHKFRLRHEETWNRTNYGFIRERADEEWSTSQDGIGTIVEEDWNITTYTPVLVHIDPGITSVTESWNITPYGNVIQVVEFWEFDIEYITDSLATQIYEEWEFDIIYVSDSFTTQLFEEWEN